MDFCRAPLAIVVVYILLVATPGHDCQLRASALPEPCRDPDMKRPQVWPTVQSSPNEDDKYRLIQVNWDVNEVLDGDWVGVFTEDPSSRTPEELNLAQPHQEPRTTGSVEEPADVVEYGSRLGRKLDQYTDTNLNGVSNSTIDSPESTPALEIRDNTTETFSHERRRIRPRNQTSKAKRRRIPNGKRKKPRTSKIKPLKGENMTEPTTVPSLQSVSDAVVELIVSNYTNPLTDAEAEQKTRMVGNEKIPDAPKINAESVNVVERHERESKIKNSKLPERSHRKFRSERSLEDASPEKREAHSDDEIIIITDKAEEGRFGGGFPSGKDYDKPIISTSAEEENRFGGGVGVDEDSIKERVTLVTDPEEENRFGGGLGIIYDELLENESYHFKDTLAVEKETSENNQHVLDPEFYPPTQSFSTTTENSDIHITTVGNAYEPPSTTFDSIVHEVNEKVGEQTNHSEVEPITKKVSSKSTLASSEKAESSSNGYNSSTERTGMNGDFFRGLQKADNSSVIDINILSTLDIKNDATRVKKNESNPYESQINNQSRRANVRKQKQRQSHKLISEVVVQLKTSTLPKENPEKNHVEISDPIIMENSGILDATAESATRRVPDKKVEEARKKDELVNNKISIGEEITKAKFFSKEPEENPSMVPPNSNDRSINVSRYHSGDPYKLDQNTQAPSISSKFLTRTKTNSEIARTMQTGPAINSESSVKNDKATNASVPESVSPSSAENISVRSEFGIDEYFKRTGRHRLGQKSSHRRPFSTHSSHSDRDHGIGSYYRLRRQPVTRYSSVRDYHDYFDPHKHDRDSHDYDFRGSGRSSGSVSHERHVDYPDKHTDYGSSHDYDYYEHKSKFRNSNHRRRNNGYEDDYQDDDHRKSHEVRNKGYSSGKNTRGHQKKHNEDPYQFDYGDEYDDHPDYQKYEDDYYDEYYATAYDTEKDVIYFSNKGAAATRNNAELRGDDNSTSTAPPAEDFATESPFLQDVQINGTDFLTELRVDSANISRNLTFENDFILITNGTNENEITIVASDLVSNLNSVVRVVTSPSNEKNFSSIIVSTNDDRDPSRLVISGHEVNPSAILITTSPLSSGIIVKKPRGLNSPVEQDDTFKQMSNSSINELLNNSLILRWYSVANLRNFEIEIDDINQLFKINKEFHLNNNDDLKFDITYFENRISRADKLRAMIKIGSSNKVQYTEAGASTHINIPKRLPLKGSLGDGSKTYSRQDEEKSHEKMASVGTHYSEKDFDSEDYQIDDKYYDQNTETYGKNKIKIRKNSKILDYPTEDAEAPFITDENKMEIYPNIEVRGEKKSAVVDRVIGEIKTPGAQIHPMSLQSGFVSKAHFNESVPESLRKPASRPMVVSKDGDDVNFEVSTLDPLILESNNPTTGISDSTERVANVQESSTESSINRNISSSLMQPKNKIIEAASEFVTERSLGNICNGSTACDVEVSSLASNRSSRMHGEANFSTGWSGSQPWVKFSALPTSTAGKITSTVAFPRLSSSELAEGGCVGHWVAYIRQGQVIDAACIQAHPTWMWDNRDVLINRPLEDLAILGSHNAGSLTANDSYDAVANWVVCQDETILDQLLYGVRHLDIRLGYYPDMPEKLWINHDKVRWMPFSTLTDDVLHFTKLSPDPVILDIHRTPVGFEDPQATVEVLEAIETKLGALLFPYPSKYDSTILAVHDSVGNGTSEASKGFAFAPTSDRVTLGDIWEAGRSVIVCWGDEGMRLNHPWLWPTIPQEWANTKVTTDLINFMEKSSRKHHRTTHFWALMAHLTPSIWDVILPGGIGVRGFADRVAEPVDEWLDSSDWLQSGNIIAVDFFHGSRLLNRIIDINIARATCPEVLHERVINPRNSRGGIPFSHNNWSFSVQNSDIYIKNEKALGTTLRGNESGNNTNELKGSLSALLAAGILSSLEPSGSFGAESQPSHFSDESLTIG
ncbi:uncharacterized protein LOC108676615 [Hyalella azteca]|uniref:Uncharacterized protein LOC108676615 n=1 Tax=Hyalella azteca TaxID=294128 RepID=A0A8B7P283_HYAAZ|nr:uncharacterized protein LOC108676615 [Hyalella azteca]